MEQGNVVNSFNLRGTGGYGCQNSELVKGKIIICQSYDGLNEAYNEWKNLNF